MKTIPLMMWLSIVACTRDGVAHRFVRLTAATMFFATLFLMSPLHVSESRAGYWHTENLYGVELNRVEADGLNVGIAMASDFYNTSYGSGPISRCYKYTSDKVLCESGSASIYCTSPSPGLTPCLRQAIHKCWDGLDGIHKKEIETDNFECQIYCPTCEAKAARGDIAFSDTLADPVEIYSGRVVESVTDWSDSSGKFKLIRNYASTISSLGAPTQSRFGNNWRSGFDSRIYFTLPLAPATLGERMHIMMPNGIEIIFRKDWSKWQLIFDAGTPNYPNIRNWQPVTDVDYSVVSTSPNIVVQTPNGTRYTYGLVDGLLIQIDQVGGYKQFLSYADTVNTRVTDSLGRTITFEYFTDTSKKKFAKSATLPDGKKIYFDYAERLLPIPGVFPGSPKHESYILADVVYPDSTPANLVDNPRRFYEYLNDYHFQNALTRVTNETGAIVGEWTYDAQGRALTARDYGATVASTFSYDDVNKKVTYTNALGKATTFAFFVNAAGETILQSVDGIASTNCSAANTAYVFDANGYRSQATDAEGRVTKWVREARGLPTSTTEGFGTAAAKTTTQVWDTARSLPTQVVIPNRTTNMTYDTDGNITQTSVVDTTSATLPQPTRITAFGYTAFSPPAPPAISASGTVLPDVPLSISNADAETGPVSGALTGWTNVDAANPLAIATSVACTAANRCFNAGVWLAGITMAYQDVAVPSANFTEVDSGLRAATVAWIQNSDTRSFYLEDAAAVELQFFNASNTLLGVNRSAIRVGRFWEARQKTVPIPSTTRSIRVQMTIRNGNNGGFIDNLSLKLIGNGSAAVKPYLTVANPDALGGVTTGWTQVAGVLGAQTVTPCDITSCFIGNGIIAGTPPTALPLDSMSQDIALPAALAAQVDLGSRGIDIGWLDTVTNDGTQTSVQVDFLDAANAIIANSTTESPPYASLNKWLDQKYYVDVPPLARKIRLTFKFTRNVLVPTPAGYISGITVQLRDRQLPTGAMSLLTSVDGPLAGIGDKVTYAYDTKGNLASVTNEVGQVTQITSYNLSGLPLSITDPNSVITTLAYDERNRLTTVTVNPGAAQAQTIYTYDAAGNVTKITRPDGSFLQYAYNNALRVTSVTNNTGETITYGYNGNGDMTSSTIKSSSAVITKQMTMAYDELGRLLKSIGAATQTTTYSYDRTDLTTQVKDPRNNLYGMAYDSLQRLVSTTDQETKTITLTRNGQDDVTGYQDPRAITTSYVRNGFGEVIQEASPDAGTTVYNARDARGLVTQMTDGRGVVTNSTYDNAGRLLTLVYPAATTENVTYTYDSTVGGNKGVGRLTKITDQSGCTEFTYNALGLIITDKRTIATKVYTTCYLYNAAGNITQVTYPSGRIVIYARNTLGQVTGVTTKQNATAAVANVATSIAYAPMSNLITALNHGNGLATTAAYDLDYRITSLILKNGAANVSSLAYAYTDNINLTGITDGVTAANSNVLAYTSTNRLASATGNFGSSTYSYDGVGNRVSDVNTLSAVTKTRAFTTATTSNRLSTITENAAAFRSYSYDGAGNILTDVRPGESFAFTYNKRNRPVSVTRNAVAYATYGYNALEQLTTRSTSAAGGPTGQVAYIYDLEGHLIAEATASTGATTRDYLWMAANDNTPVDLPLAVADISGTVSTVYQVHTDHLGRPIRMTDAAKATVWQATYKPFGEVQTTSGTKANNLRFPGQYFHIETSYAYNWHRHYDPVSGRYTQPDPLRFVDGPSMYAYGKNTPIMTTDRTGLNTPAKEYPRSEMPQSDKGTQICGWSIARETCHDLCFHHLFDGSGVGSYRKCVRACLPPEERDNF